MIKTDTLYYCKEQGHLWYYDDNDEESMPLFYAWLGDATDEEVEEAEERYCGCNDH